MAITYQEQAALMTDPIFLGRVKVSCLLIAAYILGEGTSVPAHNTRVRWAQAVLGAPDVKAFEITPIVVGDPAVLDAGADIADDALKNATEAALGKIL